MKAKTFLTPAQRQRLFRDFQTGEFTRAALAEKYGVSASTAGTIIAEQQQAADEAASAPLAGVLELGELSATIKARAAALGYTATVTIEQA